MKEKIVERVLNDDGDVGTKTSIDETPPLVETILLIVLVMVSVKRGYVEVPLEILNLNVLWIVVWAVMMLGGAVVAVVLSAYIAPRFGLFALPVGFGLAVVDVYIVLPRTFLFVAERVVRPMYLAAYPDYLSNLLTLVGTNAVTGPIALLAVGFMLQGVGAGLRKVQGVSNR